LPLSPRHLHGLLLVLVPLQSRGNALGHVSRETGVDDEEMLLGLRGVREIHDQAPAKASAKCG